jgi:muramoyltetrapeptide carboxypeptidase
MAGGNLEIITRLLGTPYSVDLGAAVFIIEDVGERPYRVDRALTQLKLAGSLDGVRAVGVGDFLRCEEEDGHPPSVAEVIEERLVTFDLPGVSGVPVGHGERNRAFSVGAKCAVDLGNGRIIVEEPAVG